MLGEAREYNEKLAANGDRWHMTAESRKLYSETLDVTGTGIMGYVTIPRIKSQTAHLPRHQRRRAADRRRTSGWSSAGRRRDNACGDLGHTGLPSARLLTGLDELEKGGDTFAFHVLDRSLHV